MDWPLRAAGGESGPSAVVLDGQCGDMMPTRYTWAPPNHHAGTTCGRDLRYESESCSMPRSTERATSLPGAGGGSLSSGYGSGTSWMAWDGRAPVVATNVLANNVADVIYAEE